MENSHQGPELSSTYGKIRITGVLVIDSLLYLKIGCKFWTIFTKSLTCIVISALIYLVATLSVQIYVQK